MPEGGWVAWAERFHAEHEAWVNVGAAVLVSVVAYFALKLILVRALKLAAARSRTTWDDVLVEQRVFQHLPFLAPAAVSYFWAPFFPEGMEEVVRRIATAYIAVNVVILIDRLLGTVHVLVERHAVSRKRAIPVKSWVQLAKIFLYIMGGIVAVSLLMNQSPWAFLGGIGAATAVLLLIFRDTILSFVASIQIANNDMVRVGDWIEMPKYDADGDVVEIALNTIKVQNWDKTITTIPTYKLVEDSFKNWRGMQESGGRRIARSLMLDQTSVRFLDDRLVERLGRIQILRPYIESRIEEVAAWNAEKGFDTAEVMNGRRLTNIGTFRAYVSAYLEAHPRVSRAMIRMVRLQAPTAEGIPLQVYAFADTTAWVEYEGIQSDIFDHLLAAVPEFGLRVYQHPSGEDVRSAAGLLAGASRPA